MTIDAAVELAREVAAAHGSASLAAADHIALSFSSGGLAFAAKGQADALASVEARLSPVRQQMTLTGDSPRSWTVNIVSNDEMRSRLGHLRTGARRFRWQPRRPRHVRRCGDLDLVWIEVHSVRLAHD